MPVTETKNPTTAYLEVLAEDAHLKWLQQQHNVAYRIDDHLESLGFRFTLARTYQNDDFHLCLEFKNKKGAEYFKELLEPLSQAFSKYDFDYEPESDPDRPRIVMVPFQIVPAVHDYLCACDLRILQGLELAGKQEATQQ